MKEISLTSRNIFDLMNLQVMVHKELRHCIFALYGLNNNNNITE